MFCVVVFRPRRVTLFGDDRRQFVQMAGRIRSHQVPPGHVVGTTKHFFRMACRSSSQAIAADQVSGQHWVMCRVGISFVSVVVVVVVVFIPLVLFYICAIVLPAPV